jgi:hypothetical protein
MLHVLSPGLVYRDRNFVASAPVRLDAGYLKHIFFVVQDQPGI